VAQKITVSKTLEVEKMKTKFSLLLLAATLVSVVALATAGNAKIQYFEDLEEYKKDHAVADLEGWEQYGPGTAAVDSDVSFWIKDGCREGKNSLFMRADGQPIDYGMRFKYPTLNLTLQTTSAIGCGAMKGPGPNEAFNVMVQDAAGNQYTLSCKDDGKFQYLSELDGTGWIETQIPCEPGKWYRVIWAGSGATLDQYVKDSEGNETLLYESEASPVISTPYVRLLVRYDTRVDNIFIADSKDEIDKWFKGCFAVFPSGKLATIWARLKAW